MKTTKFLLYAIMAFAIVLTSCDGEDGSNGLDGAIGPAGPAGQDGVNGIDGTDGNANVIVSDWIPTNFGNVASPLAFFDITDEKITPESTNNAAILAFGRNGSVISSIPIIGVNQGYIFSVDASNNIIRFAAFTLDGTNEVFSAFAEVQFVIIPSADTIAKSAVDFTDYQSLKTYYNLID